MHRGPMSIVSWGWVIAGRVGQAGRHDRTAGDRVAVVHQDVEAVLSAPHGVATGRVPATPGATREAAVEDDDDGSADHGSRRRISCKTARHLSSPSGPGRPSASHTASQPVDTPLARALHRTSHRHTASQQHQSEHEDAQAGHCSPPKCHGSGQRIHAGATGSRGASRVTVPRAFLSRLLHRGHCSGRAGSSGSSTARARTSNEGADAAKFRVVPSSASRMSAASCSRSPTRHRQLSFNPTKQIAPCRLSQIVGTRDVSQPTDQVIANHVLLTGEMRPAPANLVCDQAGQVGAPVKCVPDGARQDHGVHLDPQVAHVGSSPVSADASGTQMAHLPQPEHLTCRCVLDIFCAHPCHAR